MTLSFPSSEFDDTVAAVCHGSAVESQMRALNELLRSDRVARDEYLLRVELHSRLASEPDLFSQLANVTASPAKPDVGQNRPRGPHPPSSALVHRRTLARALALAACTTTATLPTTAGHRELV